MSRRWEAIIFRAHATCRVLLLAWCLAALSACATSFEWNSLKGQKLFHPRPLHLVDAIATVNEPGTLVVEVADDYDQMHHLVYIATVVPRGSGRLKYTEAFERQEKAALRELGFNADYLPTRTKAVKWLRRHYLYTGYCRGHSLASLRRLKLHEPVIVEKWTGGEAIATDEYRVVLNGKSAPGRAPTLELWYGSEPEPRIELELLLTRWRQTPLVIARHCVMLPLSLATDLVTFPYQLLMYLVLDYWPGEWAHCEPILIPSRELLELQLGSTPEGVPPDNPSRADE